MNSIQSFLTRRLVVVLVALSVLGGGSLFALLRHMMWKEFDRSLGVRTHALQSLITRKPSGRLDVDIFLQSLPEFTRSSPPEYFTISDADGKSVASSSRQRLQPTSPVATDIWDARLPGGEPARALRVTFMPPIDDDGFDSSTPAVLQAQPYRLPLTLTVARDVRPMSLFEIRIATYIAIATSCFSAFTVVAAVWIVRSGLASLRHVAADASSINFRDPRARFATETIPAELEPIVQKLNDLLRRVADAFSRERQFTAAVSHELRTPIAELRVAAEVALRDTGNQSLQNRAVTQSRDIALQMQTIVSTLLAIVSQDRAAEDVRLVPVSLAEALDRAIARSADRLKMRSVHLDFEIDRRLDVQADAALLSAIFENLLGNIAQYATSRSSALVSSVVDGEFIELWFENDHDRLSPADVERMFDPFWRKDESRSAGEHVGLGLALTRAYCVTMQASISALQMTEQRLRIVIRFRNAALARTSAIDPSQQTTPVGGML